MTQSEIIKAIEVLTKVIEVNVYTGPIAEKANEKIERLIPLLDEFIIIGMDKANGNDVSKVYSYELIDTETIKLTEL